MESSDSTPTTRPRLLRIIATIAIGICIGLTVGYFIFSPPSTSSDTVAAPPPDATAEVWTCSMHPKVRQPGPGLCPICAMELIPAGTAATGSRAFATTPEAVALLNIATAPVERKFVESNIRMVGTVTYDETRLAYITAWVPGRIERMYADFTGTLVRQGDHMVDFYSPELIAAKDELRRAKQALDRLSDSSPAVLRETAKGTREAVRSKLKRWGLTEAQIDRAEKSGADSDQITIYAPIGGTVIERAGQEGMYVDTGERIYTIADLSALWITLEAYESDLPWLHLGQGVEFTTEAYGGETFTGTIAFIEPTLDTRTRTVDVRVNVDNDRGRLKPGMFVRATVRSQVATGGRVMDPGLAGKWISPMHPEIVKDGPGSCDICGMALVSAEELGYVAADAGPEVMPLVIPATAALLTGERAVVYVEVSDQELPHYEGRVVTLGPRAGEYYIVESGLREGERVVIEGNFQIDSALEIAGQPSMMSITGAPDAEHDELIAAYFQLSSALAYDDFSGASEAVTRFVKVQSDQDIPGLGEELASATAAETIEELRQAFEGISVALIDYLKDAESPSSTIFVAHCPMAFDNKGASWLQDSRMIENPYFGAEMFTCGSIENELSPGVRGNAAHSGHNHDD